MFVPRVGLVLVNVCEPEYKMVPSESTHAGLSEALTELLLGATGVEQ